MRRRNFLRRAATGTGLIAGVGTATARPRGRRHDLFQLETVGRTSTDVVDEATASFDDQAVVLTGSVAGRNGCVDARAAGVDSEDGVPVVTIERTYSGSICTQALTAVEYHGTLSPVLTAPDAVVVRYVDSNSGREFWRERLPVGDGSTPDDGIQTSFSVLGTESGSTSSASVGVDGSTVTVDGTIVGSDSCATAALAGVAVEDGTLTVDVVTESRGGPRTLCAQVLTAVDYRATAELSSPPSSVVVRHDGSVVASVAV